MSDDLTIEETAFLEEQFKRELVSLVTQPVYNGIAYLVITGLIQLVATMMWNGARADPRMLPTLLLHCDQLRDYVQTATASDESTPPTFH